MLMLNVFACVINLALGVFNIYHLPGMVWLVPLNFFAAGMSAAVSGAIIISGD